MKKHRKRPKRTRQLGSIERTLLEDLSAGDLLYGFLLSARSSSRMMRLARERATERYRRKQAIERLKDLDFIVQHGEQLSITTNGSNALHMAVRLTRILLGSGGWDKKWRVVAFDIPERYSELRDKIRYVLKRSGFVRLQQSVWVFPYECKELVGIIKESSGLSKYVLYGVLEYVEDETRLKKIFGLK